MTKNRKQQEINYLFEGFPFKEKSAYQGTTKDESTCKKNEKYEKPACEKDHKEDFCCKIKATCDLEDVRPAVVDLPYPALKVQCQNKYYAKLLAEDFSDVGSELTAIMQYINHEIRFTKCYCEISKTLLAIALAEMDHLQMLGELITLLGAPLTYDISSEKGCMPWNSDIVFYGTNVVNMLISDLKGEYGAIEQYKSHIKKIDDPCINAVLSRIIKDEEYHIQLISSLIDNLDCCSLDSCNK